MMPQLARRLTPLRSALSKGATAMSKDDYKVGYKCPPKYGQFVPGESGNKGAIRSGPSSKLRSSHVSATSASS